MSRGAANADFQGAKTGFQGAKNTRKVVSALGNWFHLVKSVPPLSLGCSRLLSPVLACSRLTIAPIARGLEPPTL